MRSLALCLLFLTALFATAFAQDGDKTAVTSCTFQDDKDISVRYPTDVSSKGDLSFGKVWMPGGAPLLLFTQSEVTLGNAAIPVGAFSIYIIPEKKAWTLIVNKNVAADKPYDQQQDLGRATMEGGQLSQAEPQFKAFFGHIAPKTCSLRLYMGKIGMWVQFEEK